MDIIERLDGIYAGFVEEAGAGQENGWRAALSVMASGRNAELEHASRRFASQLQAALEEFSSSRPSPEDTAQVAAYVMDKDRDEERVQIRLMLTAVMGYLVPLVERLSPKDAARLCEELDRRYRRADRTPVMNELRGALAAKAAE